MSTLTGPILVPLDGSSTSASILPYAVALARALQLPVVLFQAVDPHSVMMPQAPVGARPAGSLCTAGRRGFEMAQTQLIDQELGKVRAHLESVAATFGEHDVAATVLVHEGTAAETILAAAHETGAGLVAMSTHGHTGLQRLMMGSVTDRVVHDAHLPMLVAHPIAGAALGEPHWQRVLLPLDGSAGAAEAGVPVAKALGAPVNLGRIIPPPKVAITGTPGDLTGAVELLSYAADDALGKAQAYLEDIAARMRAEGVKTEQFAAIGLPEEEILKMAEPQTLLVMATHGRTGVARMVQGSVADRVMRTANSAVLLVPREH